MVYIDQFNEYIQKENCQFNSNMIPYELAEENTDDPFAYEFLMMYAGWGFSDNIEKSSTSHQSSLVRKKQRTSFTCHYASGSIIYSRATI